MGTEDLARKNAGSKRQLGGPAPEDLQPFPAEQRRPSLQKKAGRERALRNGQKNCVFMKPVEKVPRSARSEGEVLEGSQVR